MVLNRESWQDSGVECQLQQDIGGKKIISVKILDCMHQNDFFLKDKTYDCENMQGFKRNLHGKLLTRQNYIREGDWCI